MEKVPKIFISYSWADNIIVDKVDKDLQLMGILSTRDIRDLKHKDNLDEFEKKVKYHDFTVQFISKSFLESEECMNEVLEIMKLDEYDKKVIPIIIDNINISKPEKWIQYYDFWKKKYEELKNELIKREIEALTKTNERLKFRRRIYESIDEFLYFLSRHRYFKYEEIIQDSYSKFLEYIGLSEVKNLSILYNIYYTDNKYLRDIYILDYTLKHQNHLSYYFFGFVEMENLNLHKSKYLFTESINLNNNFAPAYISLADININNFEDAEKNYTKAIELEPNYAEALFKRGTLYLNYDKVDQALIDFTNALNINSNDCSILINRGLAYNLKKEFKNAIEDLNKAIEIDNKRPNAYANRASTRRSLNDIPGALDDYEKAIELDPKRHTYYVNRGLLYMSIGKINEALNDFNKVSKLQPDDILNLINKGILYSEYMDDLDNAEKQFNKVLKLKPKSRFDLFSFAFRAYVKKNYSSAIRSFSKYIIEEEADIGYYYRGKCFFKLNKYDEAIEDFSASLKSMHEGFKFYWRGKAYEAKGNKKLADIDLKKAKSLGYFRN